MRVSVAGQTGIRLSLWRALTAFRLTTLLIALCLILRWQPIYERPVVALAVGAAMAAVTAAVGVLALSGRAHRPAVVVADIVVTAALTLLTIAAQTGAQRHGGMVTLTTIWAAGPVIEAALVSGAIGGMSAGLLTYLVSALVADSLGGRTLYGGALLLLTGGVTGLVAVYSVRAEEELRVAAAAQAALAERENLARSIHDGVLQVLGLVHRTGRDADEPWRALAEAAAEQERALRRLLTSRPVAATPGHRVDLTAILHSLQTDVVTVSGPAEPVLTSWSVADELAGAVRAALDNVVLHAGPGTRVGTARGRRATASGDRARRRLRGHHRTAGRSGERGPARGGAVGPRAHRRSRGAVSDHLGARRGNRDPHDRAELMTSDRPAVRVMIVDDHPIWRDALERDLVDAAYVVVGAFGDGETAVRVSPAVRPEVVLMDLQLPGMSGVEAAAQLVGADASVRILMFSASGEGQDVLAAMKVGARGYLVKSAGRAELLAAVERTAAGQATFSPGLAALVLGEHQRIGREEPSQVTALTERETEVLRFVSTGLSARQIGQRLGVSHRTVQNHVQNTLQKLQLHNRVELTRWAIEQGISEQGISDQGISDASVSG